MFLGLELLRSIDVSIRNLESAGAYSDPTDPTGNEMFLFNAVTVPEGVPIKENIVCYGGALKCEKEMYPKSC